MRTFPNLRQPAPEAAARFKANLAKVDKACRAMYAEQLKMYVIVEAFGDCGIYHIPGAPERDVFVGLTPAKGAEVYSGSLRTVRANIARIQRATSIPGFDLMVAYQLQNFQDKCGDEMEDMYAYGRVLSIRMTYRESRLAETAIVLVGDEQREVAWHRLMICDSQSQVDYINAHAEARAAAREAFQAAQALHLRPTRVRKRGHYSHLEHIEAPEIKALARAQSNRRRKHKR